MSEEQYIHNLVDQIAGVAGTADPDEQIEALRKQIDSVDSLQSFKDFVQAKNEVRNIFSVGEKRLLTVLSRSQDVFEFLGSRQAVYQTYLGERFKENFREAKKYQRILEDALDFLIKRRYSGAREAQTPSEIHKTTTFEECCEKLESLFAELLSDIQKAEENV